MYVVWIDLVTQLTNTETVVKSRDSDMQETRRLGDSVKIRFSTCRSLTLVISFRFMGNTFEPLLGYLKYCVLHTLSRDSTVKTPKG